MSTASSQDARFQSLWTCSWLYPKALSIPPISPWDLMSADLGPATAWINLCPKIRHTQTDRRSKHSKRCSSHWTWPQSEEGKEYFTLQVQIQGQSDPPPAHQPISVGQLTLAFQSYRMTVGVSHGLSSEAYPLPSLLLPIQENAWWDSRVRHVGRLTSVFETHKPAWIEADLCDRPRRDTVDVEVESQEWDQYRQRSGWNNSKRTSVFNLCWLVFTQSSLDPHKYDFLHSACGMNPAKTRTSKFKRTLLMDIIR